MKIFEINSVRFGLRVENMEKESSSQVDQKKLGKDNLFNGFHNF